MRGAVLSLLVALMLAATAACGGDGEKTAVGETEAGATDAPNEAAVLVAGDAERTTPIAKAQEASIELPSPDWLTFHGGYVWVKRDDGFVARIDPRTNKPKGEVRADTKSEQLCQGIGSGGGAIWSCSGSDIVRIDPKRLKVTKSIPVGKTFDSGRLPFASGKIWVLSGEGDRLVGIDTKTARVSATVKLPVPCGELGSGGGAIWAFCPRDGKVIAVNPESASVESQFDLDEPSNGTASDDALWVGSAGSLVRFDLQTLEPVARFANLDPSIEGTVHVDGENVWVRTPSGFLHRVDAASNTVAEHIEPASSLSGGDVIAGAGSLWTTAFNDGVLLRLRADA